MDRLLFVRSLPSSTANQADFTDLDVWNKTDDEITSMSTSSFSFTNKFTGLLDASKA
jgi:kynureninase